MKVLHASVLVLLLGLLPQEAVAASGVAGNVSYLRGDVTVVHGDTQSPLSMDQEVFPSDTVITGENGRVKLSMKDGTAIYVGRRSRIVIDAYHVKGDWLKSGFFNMLWGKARFVVAKLQFKDASFTVRTTTATIGVRGTVFTVSIPRPDDLPAHLPPKLPASLHIPKVPTEVLLQEGAIFATSFRGAEKMIKPGFVANLTTAGGLNVRKFTPADLKSIEIDLPDQARRGKGVPQPGSRVGAMPSKPFGAKPAVSPVPTNKPVNTRTRPSVAPPVTRPSATPPVVKPVAPPVVRPPVTPPVVKPVTPPVVRPPVTPPVVKPVTPPVVKPRLP